jgi:hypothetical protein
VAPEIDVEKITRQQRHVFGEMRLKRSDHAGIDFDRRHTFDSRRKPERQRAPAGTDLEEDVARLGRNRSTSLSAHGGCRKC